MELSYGTDAKDSNDHPTDIDGDGVPDNVSPDGKYTGDVDDDGDSLTDTIEASLGSNPRDESDVKKIYIGGKPYYLIDVTQDEVYDILYEPTGDTTTAVEKYNENYLIDENGDGAWDYIYNTADGSISAYEEEQITLTLIIWILLILAILLAALFVSSYYLRRRPIKYRMPRKPEKVIEEEHKELSDEELREKLDQIMKEIKIPYLSIIDAAQKLEISVRKVRDLAEASAYKVTKSRIYRDAGKIIAEPEVLDDFSDLDGLEKAFEEEEKAEDQEAPLKEKFNQVMRETRVTYVSIKDLAEILTISEDKVREIAKEAGLRVTAKRIYKKKA